MKLPTLRKNDKAYWVYLLLGIVLGLVAIIFAPFWRSIDWAPWKNWSTIIVNLILAVGLSIYLFGFLIKKVAKSNNQSIKILTIVEFVLLLLIDLYLILGQWIPSLNIIKVNGACAIAGLALWIRGVVEIFRAYFYRHNDSNKYPIWWLCIAIAFVSLGIWMLVAPFIDDITIVWILVIFILVVGLYLIFYGIYSKPKKTKKKN